MTWETQAGRRRYPLVRESTPPTSEQGPSYFENRKRGLPQLFFHSLRPGGRRRLLSTSTSPTHSARRSWCKELNSEAVDARPSITADGLEIFFHSNRPVRSAWVRHVFVGAEERARALVCQPEPLGTVVNTAASDFLGAISPDGETLFFSSTRDGSNDIYVTTRSKARKTLSK